MLPLIEYFAHFVNVKPDEGGSSLVQGFGLDPQKYFDNKTRTGIRLGKGGGGQCERNFLLSSMKFVKNEYLMQLPTPNWGMVYLRFEYSCRDIDLVVDWGS